ncbi:hypothetical protein FisN_12Lh041 [Fistulifera solaris]|uniref:Uncharacterized protein n=1 Tax=Fistulifera solaris TaxID=1519565 RepID=A0A1Z5KGQ6_FISSO|nr:hypothetical protein FisN_12Lh041 [Fistulifera solaris]|eukprot:GAX25504.1 hypothetical protein FisN_12Lh041 [Fistulifera solaris]
MTVRPKAASNSLTRIAQESSPKLRDGTLSLRTETTAPSSDEEISPGKQQFRVKVKVRKGAADQMDHHRSLNALELEKVIRNLHKTERPEKKSSPKSVSSERNSQLNRTLERFHQSSPDGLNLENYENMARRGSIRQNTQKRSGSVSRRRSATSRDRSRERSTRTSRTLQDLPTTPRSKKSSVSQAGQETSLSPPRKPRVAKETQTPRGVTPRRTSTKVSPSANRTTSRRPSARVQPMEPKERRAVSRTRSNHFEDFKPADVIFPDPWTDVRSSRPSDSRVNNLVLQSGIITAGQLQQLLDAGFTFNGPEFLDAFP